MLVFDVACNSPRRPDGPRMAVAWTDAGQQQPADRAQVIFVPDNSGPVIVPLDANPRWLLANRPARLFLLFDPNACSSVSLSDFTFARRDSALPSPLPGNEGRSPGAR